MIKPNELMIKQVQLMIKQDELMIKQLRAMIKHDEMMIMQVGVLILPKRMTKLLVCCISLAFILGCQHKPELEFTEGEPDWKAIDSIFARMDSISNSQEGARQRILNNIEEEKEIFKNN